MSVKTRDRPSSPTSTTTDRTGFLSKKNQDLFAPNDFYKEGSLQRPYSFAPQGVPEESERSFQTGDGAKNPQNLYNRQQNTFQQPLPPRQPLREVLHIQQRPPQPEAYHPQMAQLFLQQDTLPQEVMFLLAEEDNHIGKFRSRVEKEKQRIEKDVDLARTEIVNLLEDLKIQMCTYVDDHYKRYISVYAAFKEEIIQFKQQKLQVPLHLTPPPQKDLSTASNQNLIRELEEIQYKNQIAKLNTYVSEINKARAMRISDISKDLLQLTSSASQLYNSENSSRQLGQLKNEITKQLVQRFAQMSDFVQPLDYLLNRDQSRILIEEDSRQRISVNEYEVPNSFQKHNQTQMQTQNQTQTQLLGHQGPSLNQFSAQMSPPGNFSQLSPIYSQPMLATFQSGQNTAEPRKFSAPFTLDPVVHQQVYAPQTVFSQAFNSGNPQRTSPASPQIIQQSIPQSQSNQQQGAQIQDQNIQLKEIQKIPLNHKQMPLCFVQIDGLWASGSRDGAIKIWEGSKCVSELNGHTGAVCCLTVLRQNGVPIYLVSGSDTVETSIIIWNLQTLQLERVLRGHTAAVVALLSLDDGQTVISGSYDKSIMIWSSEGGETQQFNNTHSNAITCLALSKGFFVSGGLDGQINVWRLKFNVAGTFESTQMERSIKNGSIVCAIVCQGEQILSGGKDGKVRIFSRSGEQLKQFSVCGGPIVEMLTYGGVLVSMSSKDKNLILSNIQNGEIQSLDTQNNSHVEFGCGVYPKMTLHRDVLQLLNQAEGSLHLFRLL